MAAKLTSTQKIIQANERGNPRMNGSGEEKKRYPGHPMASVARNITKKKRYRPLRRVQVKAGSVVFGIGSLLMQGIYSING